MTMQARQVHAQDVAEINIIPLADVLLVLLIIFMVTAPVATRSLPLDLNAGIDGTPPPAEPIVLRVDAAGDVYRDGALVPAPALAGLLQAAARATATPPALRIDASDQADYESVAQVLAAARGAGLANIGFLPPR